MASVILDPDSYMHSTVHSSLSTGGLVRAGQTAAMTLTAKQNILAYKVSSHYIINYIDASGIPFGGGAKCNGKVQTGVAPGTGVTARVKT